jgi:hypothetical protein
LNNAVAQKLLSFTLLDFIWRKSSSFINTNEDTMMIEEHKRMYPTKDKSIIKFKKK